MSRKIPREFVFGNRHCHICSECYRLPRGQTAFDGHGAFIRFKPCVCERRSICEIQDIATNPVLWAAMCGQWLKDCNSIPVLLPR